MTSSGGDSTASAVIPRRAGTLPAEVTSFVGRRHELADARRLLTASRLLTLTGPGGVGKTRLALRLADQLRRAFADGVFLVELDALKDAALLPQTVARALGVRDSAEDPLGQLADFLKDKRLLLVLDNCEHMADACAMLSSKLLAAAPRLRILATSRQVLGIEGEQIMPVPPLRVPEDRSGRADATAGSHDALGLFADRAAAVFPTFAVDGGNRERILDICRRLDGMPLAIELAAVRLRALSLDEIAERLDDRFGLLAHGNRAAPSRQQSLSGAIGWSHDLCSREEQLIWARLSVFAGSFGLDAAEDVAAGEEVAREAVVGLVAALVDKSILVRDANSHGLRARYRMLETIRRYGLERLTATGGEPAVRARHLAYYRRLAEQYEQDRFSRRQLDWIDRLSAEHANLRVALEFGLDAPEHAAAAMDVAAKLWNFWFAGGFLREGLRWLERALAANPEPSRSRAEALWTCAFLSSHCGAADQAQRLLAECRPLAEALGEPRLEAHVALCCGQAALFAGDLDEAAQLLEQAVHEHRALGDAQGLADSLIVLAGAQFFLHDPRGASTAGEVLDLCERHGTEWTKTYALWATALPKWLAGQHAGGAAVIQQAIRMERTARDWTGLAYLLEVLSWCTGGMGQPERCGRLLGAAETMWRLSGARADEAPPYHAVNEEVAKRARAAIGQHGFDAACAQGRGMRIEEVFAYALEEEPETRKTGPAEPDELGLLTPREHEIAVLVAEGLSNKQIAGRLTISQRTVEGHVENVLTKLGFTSRTQIAAWLSRFPGSG